MLSLKASLSGKDNIPILVFDEIDAGISGRIAGKVGKLLSDLAKSHQIISITHLPQIAAMSDNHFYVSKKDVNSETIAEIKPLKEDEVITEVARLLSGEKITNASKVTAKELREFKH
jgi:DNA repair protein RecN (Recombination protein N)